MQLIHNLTRLCPPLAAEVAYVYNTEQHFKVTWKVHMLNAKHSLYPIAAVANNRIIMQQLGSKSDESCP